MASYQHVVIMGNLGKDPNMRYTANGSAITEFSVAVNESYGSGDERKERVEWFNCVCWNKTAEIAGQYLAKGRQVLCEGKMQTDQWEKDGQKHYRTRMLVTRLTLMGSSNKQEGPADDDLDLPFN